MHPDPKGIHFSTKGEVLASWATESALCGVRCLDFVVFGEKLVIEPRHGGQAFLVLGGLVAAPI